MSASTDSPSDLSGLEDRRLVRRYLALRDEESFRAIYRRHSPKLYRLCLSMIGDPDLAADAVQDAWLRAARGLDLFRWSSSLGTWLSGIAINCCREMRRKQPEEELPTEPAAEPDSADDWMDLIRAIASLPERANEVLVLHEIFGYTHEEVAGILGIDEGTSKSQLSYARKLMRRWFEAQAGARPEGVDHVG